jgi:GT2 family glycosyltransferase
MTDNPKIAAIILNTNKKHDTLECLGSLLACQYPNLNIIVLDNASTDGSNAAIADQYPNVEIVPIVENKGYAGNNNVGIQYALRQNPDWLFILNEDIVFDKNTLNIMMSSVINLPRAGIIGPLVFHHSEPDIIQSAGGVLDENWDSVHLSQNDKNKNQYQSPEERDWISGCAIGVRREALQQAGLIDERFFYYWEETEWCLRIRASGWKAYIIPQAHIWHKGVQRFYKPTPNVTYYATRNRLLLFKIHHPPLKVWLSTSLYFIRTLLSWSIKPKWRDMQANRDAMWQGINDYIFQRWGMRNL